MSEKQTHRDISRTVAPTASDELRFIAGSELTRYDVLLAAIPFALLAAWVFGHLAAVPNWVALGIGALAALPALVDGIALHPPA